MKDEKTYYVTEQMHDTGGATKEQLRYLIGSGWGDISKALLFTKDQAKGLVRKWRNEFRDYNAEYFIEEVTDDVIEPVKISIGNFDLMMAPTQTNNISNVDYNYIASYIVDLRYEPDYEILDYSYLSVSGNLDADMYYSESVGNASLESFLETEITGKLKSAEIVSGVFRLVYAVKCHGEEYNTQDGVEYDAWETYELLTKTELSDEELKYVTDANKHEHMKFVEPADIMDEIQLMHDKVANNTDD